MQEQGALGFGGLLRQLRAGAGINELDVFYQKGAPKFTGADSLGTAVSP